MGEPHGSPTSPLLRSRASRASLAAGRPQRAAPAHVGRGGGQCSSRRAVATLPRRYGRRTNSPGGAGARAAGNSQLAAPAQGGDDSRRPVRAREHASSDQRAGARAPARPDRRPRPARDPRRRSRGAGLDARVDPQGVPGRSDPREDRAFRSPGGAARPADPVQRGRRARRRVGRREGRRRALAGLARDSRRGAADGDPRPDRARRQRDGDRRLAAPVRPDDAGRRHLPRRPGDGACDRDGADEGRGARGRGGRGGRGGRDEGEVAEGEAAPEGAAEGEAAEPEAEAAGDSETAEG